MCNRYGYLNPVHRLSDAFSQTRLPLRFESGPPNLEPREHIRPTNTAPVLRALDPGDPSAGLELKELRWWLVPFFHKKTLKEWKPMCTNARAETVATTAAFRDPFKRRRCLVPASHFFEWTGEKGAKTMWRFTHADSDLFCFAGLWDRASTADGEVESFTILTTAAGPDAIAIHNRQPVILDPEHWSRWLDLSADPSDLLGPSPEGTLVVEKASEPATLQ